MTSQLQLLAADFMGVGKYPDRWDAEDVKAIIERSRQQAVSGLLLAIVNDYAAGCLVSKQIILRLYGEAEFVRRRNEKTNIAVAALCRQLHGDGLRCCLLKGQGIALMYADPATRTPGDIDMWVDAEPRRVVDYARSCRAGAEYNYLHVDAPEVNGIPVELHFRCTYLYSPKANARLQQWIDEHRDEQFSHVVELPPCEEGVAVPTHGFNLILQLTHVLRHFLGVGVGLRHLVDFFYLLRQGTAAGDREEVVRLVDELGLRRFAAAMMYAVSQLGLEDQHLLLPPDEHYGRILMRQVNADGNLGRRRDGTAFFSRNIAARGASRAWRYVKIFRVCPSEATARLVYGRPKAQL